MRHIFRVAVAAVMSLSLVTPGLAYIFTEGSTPARSSRRSIESAARSMNDISTGVTRSMRMRKAAENQQNGLSKLRRASGQRFRSANRKPKEGSDRYRTFYPNTRSLRKAAEGNESMLPARLVQTGGVYDHPTRRDIWNAMKR